MRELAIAMTSTAYVSGESWSLWCHESCTVVFLLTKRGTRSQRGAPCTLLPSNSDDRTPPLSVTREVGRVGQRAAWRKALGCMTWRDGGCGINTLC